MLVKLFNILREKILCEHCTGRLIGKTWPTLTYREKGLLLKAIIYAYSVNIGNPSENIVERKPCEICENIFDTINVDDLLEKVNAILEEYECDTFSTGVSIPKRIIEKEITVQKTLPSEMYVPLKRELNLLLRKVLLEKTGRKIDVNNPDIVFIFDVYRNEVNAIINPLYIYGRYRKYSRKLPQAIWFCPTCRGRGCSRCNWTGRKYPTAINELIGKPLMELCNAEDYKFHGSGREDVDVRMLGSGRPFIVELIKPKIRNIDLESAEKAINEQANGLIEVFGLRISSSAEVEKLKERAKMTGKVYGALIESRDPIDENKLERLEQIFHNTLIKQRTPTRVLHRRADKVRHKMVYIVKILPIDKKMFYATIYCQGGLYVKELITGDYGRTKPSFSKALNKSLKVIKLDVLGVERYT
ncbi:tRNA pseudouridine(54/55) synthase Pus10 [archaeon]|nr:MAG: tRNA pseudouridine(54/55) synthase Pus10 [archaeon]RLG65702.1 MAG: tRNA pseudouridine(54/55) synthase Pus10 [archaeon]